MFLGQMPDITPAQLLAIAVNIIVVAIAFGANISTHQQETIVALAGGLGAFLIGSDAHLRGRRAHAAAIRHVAEVQASSQQTVAAGPTPTNQPQP
jgi:hypothetical protein